MGICHHCSAIASKLLSDKSDAIRWENNRKTHHQSYRDLEISALTCALCELLVERCRLLPLVENWDETHPEIWYTSSHVYDSQGRRTQCLYGFDFWYRGNWATIDLYTDEGP